MTAALHPSDLARIHAACPELPRPWSEAEFRALCQAPGAILCCGEGAFALGRVVLDEAELLTVAVEPARRRGGRARSCLECLHASALSAGATRILLEVAADNSAARHLYEALGYEETGRRTAYYPRGMDAVIMARRLSA